LYCLSAEISKQQRYRSILILTCVGPLYSFVCTAFWIITIEDTFKTVLPYDCMDIHMFNKVKTVYNKEMLLKIKM